MSQTSVRLFVARSPQAPWGDYGHILMHGMLNHAPDGTPLLFRTGPFVPPISLPPFAIVIAESVRKEMEPQAFTGFEYARVSKRRIVRLDWRAWDLNADVAPEVPETGEPEDYILKGKHSPATALEMDDLWELKVPVTPGIQIEGGSDFDPAKYHGQDLIRGHSLGGYIYISLRLRNWLTEHYAEWVHFKEVRPSSL